MLSTTGREAAISSAQPARLELKPDQHGPTVLDGGWWPRSEDPATELPGLIRALDARHGRTRRIMLGAADWTASLPRQLVFGAPQNGRVVHLGWFDTQPAAADRDLGHRPAHRPAHRPPGHQRAGGP